MYKTIGTPKTYNDSKYFNILLVHTYLTSSFQVQTCARADVALDGNARSLAARVHLGIAAIVGHRLEFPQALVETRAYDLGESRVLSRPLA